MYYIVKRKPDVVAVPKIEDCTFYLNIEPEHIPVKGNSQASGDEEADQEMENWIIERLNNGDMWAWCTVCVTAEWNGLTGTDYLGGCCFDGEGDFKSCGYWEDMKDAAYQHLLLDNHLPVKQPQYCYDSKGNTWLR